MKITKIDLTETIHTMGETTEDEAEFFVDYLRNELADEYPEAEINVTLNNRQSSTVINVETEDGWDETDARDEVHEFINTAWDKCPWENYEEGKIA